MDYKSIEIEQLQNENNCLMVLNESLLSIAILK
jgi:hypothetical protein